MVSSNLLGYSLYEWGASPVLLLFLFSFFLLQGANLIGPSLINYLAMKAPENKRFYFEVYIFFPLAHVL